MNYTTPIPMRRGVIVATVLSAPMLVAPLAIYAAVHGLDALMTDDRANITMQFVIVVLLGCVVHELLHGFAFWALGNAPWKEVHFGIKWKFLTPYASTQVAMPLAAYRWTVALPGLVLGVLPSVAAIVAGNPFWTIVGALMLCGAAGDALVLWHVRKIPHDRMIRDATDALGCEVLT